MTTLTPSTIQLQNNLSNGTTQVDYGQLNVSALQRAPVSVASLKQIDQYSQYNTMSFPIDLPKYYMQINVSNYSRATFTSIGTLTPSAGIYFPMPLQLVNVTAVDYDVAPVGAVAGVATRAMNDVTNKSKNISTAVGAIGAAVLNAAPEVASIAALSAMASGSRPGSRSASRKASPKAISGPLAAGGGLSATTARAWRQ